MSKPTSPTSDQKPWHFQHFEHSPLQSGKNFKLIQASGEDIARINAWYSHHPVKGLVLKQVTIIHNPQMARGFEARISLLEQRHNNKAFAPRWPEENQSTEEKTQRTRTITLLKSMTQPHQDPENPHVSIIPLWHGTKTEILESLFKTGFANLATTDAGFFGKGLYNTAEAEYAYRVYSGGALLVNWLAFYSAFPVIRKDMIELSGKGNYQNYDAHFIPVVPKTSNPNEASYYPCQAGQTHTYTEFVVFDSMQVLPRYLVELQPELPASPGSFSSSSSSSPPSLQVDDFLGALLTYQESLDKNSEEYQTIEAKITVYGTQNRPLNEKERAVYTLLQRIEGATGNNKNTFSKKMLALLKALNEKDELPPPSFYSGPSLSPQPPFAPAPAAKTAYPSSQPVPYPVSQPTLFPPKRTTNSPLPISNINFPIPLQASVPAIAFGKEKWATYFGDIGIEPPLPPDIDAILNAPCPIWPGKKVQDTHMLVLIPKTVNGQPLTLLSLEQLVHNPKQCYNAQYLYGFSDSAEKEHGNTSIRQSYWILMTKDVLPESRNKSYSHQQSLVADLAQKSQAGYQVPKMLEAATSIFTTYAVSRERLFPLSNTNSETFTRCQEKIGSNQSVVGGFAPASFVFKGFAPAHLFVGIRYSGDRLYIFGVAGLRKF